MSDLDAERALLIATGLWKRSDFIRLGGKRAHNPVT